MTMESEISHPEIAKTLPPSGECIDITIAANKNNSKSSMNEHRAPPTELNEKHHSHEETHRNCVNRTDLRHFIQTMMEVLIQDKPREELMDKIKQLCCLLFKDDQIQDRNNHGQQ